MRTHSLFLAVLTLTACRADPEKIDEDGDGAPLSVDCDDTDAAVNPDAAEACNEVDDDCNGAVDDVSGGAGTVYYADADGDGYGRDETAAEACEAAEGWAAAGGDCDDADAARHPDAAETDCTDDTDYNCDGSSGYADADADGHPACQDCDDADPKSNPLGTEVCDGADNDCDGTPDDDATDAKTFYADADADTYGDAASPTEACEAPTGYVADATDCDDDAATVHPGGTEVCNDVDDDCDGTADDAATDAPTWYADADGDGSGGDKLTAVVCDAPAGFVASHDDCDDLNPASHPGASEICDGKDNDCDGSVGGDESDADGDAIRGCAGDCDDTDPKIRPGADERCNGKDDDCDGSTGLGEADADGDGALVCAGDCDDAKANVFPDAPEHCDDVDEDCDGAVDEEAVDKATWYVDVDKDGHGVDAVTQVACDAPTGFVAEDDDCDDADATTYTGAPQVCSDVDHDCDGVIDGDLDEDGDISDACGGWDCDDEDPDVTAEDCIQPTCKEYRAAGHTTDGEYEIDPDGPSTGSPPYKVWCEMDEDGGGWQRCTAQKNTTAEDIVGNTWFDACVTASMASHTGAEVRFALIDGSGATKYDGTGTRTGTWTVDQITSTAALSSQYHPSNHDRTISLDTGDKLTISGKGAANSGYHGSFGNGYGVTVYPSSPTLGQPKLFVGSYMQTVQYLNARQFSGWSQATEIAWRGSVWNSQPGVDSAPSFIGTFEFYVR